MIKRIQYHHHSSHCKKQHNRTYIKSYLAWETVLDIYTYDGILQIPSNKNKELGFPSLDVYNLLLNWLSVTWHLNPSYTPTDENCHVQITVTIFHHNRLQSTQKKEQKKCLVSNGQLTGLKIKRAQEFDSCTWQDEDKKIQFWVNACADSSMPVSPCAYNMH